MTMLFSAKDIAIGPVEAHLQQAAAIVGMTRDDFRKATPPELDSRAGLMRQGINILTGLLNRLELSAEAKPELHQAGVLELRHSLLFEVGLMARHIVEIEWWLHSLQERNKPQPPTPATVTDLAAHRKRKETPPCTKSS